MKLNKLFTAFISLILVSGILFCSMPYGAVYAENVSELEDKYDDMEKQLENAKKELEKLKDAEQTYVAQRKNYEEQMSIVDGQITVIENSITELEAGILEKEAEIAELQKTVDILSAEIDENFELFKERLKAFHRRDNASTLQLLLDSESFSDFLTKYNVMKAIAKHDEQLMDKLENDKAELKQKQSDIEGRIDLLEAEKSELEAQKAVLDNKKADLEKLSNEAETALRNAQNGQKEQQELIEYIDESLEKLEKEIEEATKESQGSEYVGGEFIWPCPEYSRISSPFGYRIHPVTGKRKFHKGVDLAAAKGADILAANDGTVTAAYDYENGGYGKYVIINHGGGRVTLYAHCNDVFVRKGDKVKRGEVIAEVGTTGTSTGNHLHFEVRIDGEYTDPMDYFEKS